MTEFLLPALGNLIEPLNIVLMLAGLAGGIIIGALPGLTATMGVALMVPVTFALDATSGLIMLGAIYVGAIYGGANSACLICTPGTPSAVATTFDGWPMCQRGQADKALYSSLLSSSFGGFVGTLLLLFLAAPLARVALQFGGPENFWLCIFGLSTIAVMSSGNMLKGLLSGAIGLLITTIGMDPNAAVPRFIFFGYYPLVQGIEVIPAMIGLFSFSQVLYLVGSNKSFIAEYKPSKGAFWGAFRELGRKCKVVLLRSSLIGGIVGMMPGAGGEIASIIAYNETKRWDKDPSKFGKGAVEGIAASESANNAVIGGALIPMLTLGIPGSAVAAVILGALLAKGIQPGFKVFTASGDLAYTFIMSQFAVNLLMIPVGFLLAKIMARLLQVRLTYVAIAIVVLSVIGSYAIRNSMLDVWLVIVFGFIGYYCNRVGLDTGAMALGIILGPMIEENLGKCVHLSRAVDGSVLTVFFQSSLAVFLIALTLLSLATPFILDWRRKKSLAKEGITITEAKAASVRSAKADFLAALAVLGIAFIFHWQSAGLSGISLYFPRILIVFLTLGGLILLGLGIHKTRINFQTETGEPVHMQRVTLVSIASIINVALIPLLGFYPASAIFLFCMAMALRDTTVSTKKIAVLGVAFAIGLCLLVWVGFTILLNVPTPPSMFFES